MKWYRRDVQGQRIRLSALDTYAPNDRVVRGTPTVVLLHDHLMEGATFRDLARRLARTRRVVALDQRGHGWSDRGERYRREDYLDDLQMAFARLHLGPAVVIGHGLGGVNAYQFAASDPDRVEALVIENTPVMVDGDLDEVMDFDGLFPTRLALMAQVPEALHPYVRESLRHTRAGWRTAFSGVDVVRSRLRMNGAHWADWEAVAAPTLIVRSSDSTQLSAHEAQLMASRASEATVAEVGPGRVPHLDAPEDFAAAVLGFIAELDGEDTTGDAGADGRDGDSRDGTPGETADDRTSV